MLAALYLVWLINLTNFMDGIDGIAATETITVCAGAVCIYAMTPGAEDLWLAPSVLAAACLGFLAWNWPPAKIFMGDAGSGFLGLMLGGLSLQAAWTVPTLLWCWVILLGVFVVDATTTLMQRFVRGARLHDAHRTHAYQHAAQRWQAHAPVTWVVTAINVLWLLPCAVLVARGVIGGPAGVFLAYVPLVVLATRLGAGRP
jgi:Fuc2NAc and GlcNAc transferase